MTDLTLRSHGDRDTIPRPDDLSRLVPNVEETSLDCGHWIQQERPQQTTRTILHYLEAQRTARPAALRES